MEGDEKMLAKMVYKLRQKYPPEMFDKLLALNRFADLDKVIAMLQPNANQHTLAAPLVEVFSVTLNNLVDDGRTSYQIYGTIQVIDGEGATFFLYERTEDEPEEIPAGGGNLTLTFPSGRAITPSGLVKMIFNLVSDNVKIIVASFSLDYTSKTNYNEVVTRKVVGARGSADVRFITYSHAVFATLKVKLREDRDVDDGKSCCNFANVYGTIVARCEGSNDSIMLFQKDESESVEVEYGTLIPLFRHVAVVPVYSLLSVDVCLWNRDTGNKIADGVFESAPNHFLYSKERIYEKNVPTRIQVRAQWAHAYMQHSLENRCPGASTSQVASIKRKREGVLLVEVFSVSVWSSMNKDKNFNLWGSVSFSSDCPVSRVCLFDCDRASRLRVHKDQMLPITCANKCYTSEGFDIRLSLHHYDIDFFMISKGGIAWNEINFEDPIPWYDKKLCSVVEGDEGYYAAVHYSIFSAGSHASVKIFLKDKSSSDKLVKVHGSVCAHYSCYTYATHYEKEYFRRKLFVRDPKDPLLLDYSADDTDSDILISESLVVVPVDSDLIVEVKLSIELPPDISHGIMQITEHFKEKLVFSPVVDCKEKSIVNQAQRVVVVVEWS